MSYTKASDLYIQQYVHPDIMESVYVPLFNLSAILGDTDGRISKSDALLIKKHVSIVTPGTIIGDFISTPSVTDIITPSSFIPRISDYGFSLYQGINSDNYEIVSDEVTISPVLANMNLLSNKMSAALASIYLETLAIYKCLLSATPTEGIAPLVRKDFEILSNNVRWISYHIESIKTLNTLEVISVLRDIQKNIDYISSLNDLFNSTYNSKLQEYQQIVSGGY